jgi:hypothetical protein
MSMTETELELLLEDELFWLTSSGVLLELALPPPNRAADLSESS